MTGLHEDGRHTTGKKPELTYSFRGTQALKSPQERRLAVPVLTQDAYLVSWEAMTVSGTPWGNPSNSWGRSKQRR